MRHLLPLFFVWYSHAAHAQWITTNAPIAGRYDDLFFLTPDTGWAAGGGDGFIMRTYNGGDFWQTVYNGPDYLRSIEFLTPQLGFCGTLSETFLRTTDGGNTWEDISALLSPTPAGICGLHAVDAQTVFGVGVWSQPAYIVHTTDGGDSWSLYDASALASALVDVYFVNADTGFASGRAQPWNSGAVILRTTDAGASWHVYQTINSAEYIWKLQSHDGVHLYGAIVGLPGESTRYLRSNDAGATWQVLPVSDNYYYVEVIGFLNEQLGWTGSESLLETQDGGATWHQVFPGYAYDRFQSVSATEAYLTGAGIYKYSNASTVVPTAPPPTPRESVRVSPDPAGSSARLSLGISRSSQAVVELFDLQGKQLRKLHHGRLPEGDHQFDLDLSDLSDGRYYVMMRTDMGRVVNSFSKQ